MMTHIEFIIDTTDHGDIMDGTEWLSDMEEAHIKSPANALLISLSSPEHFPLWLLSSLSPNH